MNLDENLVHFWLRDGHFADGQALNALVLLKVIVSVLARQV